VEASCSRCHKIGAEGGEAGPALDRPDLNRTREHLLEAIVSPNSSITPGYENTVVRMKDETAYAGVLKSENEREVVLDSPEDGLITLPKDKIQSRERGGSGMPEGLAELLSKRDLRDLVEFLATVP
jgi:quinoprotein glucose dehydrogenase